jgi:ABC-type transport system substrate-binding protein
MKRIASGIVFLIMLTAAILVVPEAVKAPPTGTLIIGVQNDTPNLNPWDISTNTVWKHMMWRQWVFEGLFGVLPNATLYPVLATNYTIDILIPDQVKVDLRQGVTFTDGAPMNATDVVFSYQTMAFNGELYDPVMKSVVWPTATWPRWNASTTAWGAANPSHVGVTRFDDFSVIFHLRQNYSMFTFGTLTRPIMPSHIWMDHLIPVTLSNYILPDGSRLSGGTEFDFDKDFGSSSTDVAATIGTGPWYLLQWIPWTTMDLQVYDSYWGMGLSVPYGGRSWPFFPNNVTHMQFKIYGTLDIAILALKQGEVHIVPWSLPQGFYNDLKHDPNMGFVNSTKDGFNYLAFNMRREPFNDLNFRKAVSYAIDKNFIVLRLLGGNGFNGQVPVSLINPPYVNFSAVAPPFDLNQARSILDAAGYTDKNGDGWRDLPDGRPMKYSILTPAKDFDPIIADTGIMIANNLKSIGLNIDTAPTSFDAIKSAAWNSIYDMHLFSWENLGLFPELYLESIFGCSRMAESGLGDNTPGYCGPTFEAFSARFASEMDNPLRIQMVKDAQGLLVRDLPYNTLYVMNTTVGYRNDTWTGWQDIFNEAFNWWSVNIIGPGQPLPPVLPETSLVIGNPNYTSIWTYITSTTPLDLSVVDNSGSGINHTMIKIDLLPWADYTGTFTLSSEGVHTLQWYSVDNLGNVEIAKSRTLRVDNAPPTTNLAIGAPNFTAGVTYVNSSTPLTFNTIDGGITPSGTANTSFRFWNGSWSAWAPYTEAIRLTEPDGPFNLEFRSTDRLGNLEGTRMRSVVLDNTAPEMTLRITGENFTVDSTFNITATDDGSGVRLVEYRIDEGTWMNYTEEFKLPEGAHTLSYRATDNLGNAGVRIMELTVRPRSNPGAFLVMLWPIYLIVALAVIIVLLALRRARGKDANEAPPPEAGKGDDARK